MLDGEDHLFLVGVGRPRVGDEPIPVDLLRHSFKHELQSVGEV